MIHATLDVRIDHHYGLPVEDPEHVLRWACFMFEVCTGHPHPGECPEGCRYKFSTYRATIVSASLAEAPVAS